MDSRSEIIRQLELHQGELRAFGVRSLALFGSAARGESTEVSDLDFVVELQPKTFDAYMGLKEYLEALFGCCVDLVVRETIKPRLRNEILNSAVYASGLQAVS